MDNATTLPAEIWQKIFEMLPLQDIKAVMKVHRAFYTYGRPFIWRQLVICSLEPQHRKQAKVIIRNPTLGQHIKSLHLQPSLYEPYGKEGYVCTAATNVWVASPPIQTWFDLLRRSDWKYPIRSFQHFAYSKKTVSTALAVLPHLTHLRILQISAWFSAIPAHPEPAVYHALWAKLSMNHVTTVAFSCNSWSCLQLFSGVIQASQTMFPCLETLSFEAFFGQHDNFDLDSFEEAISTLAGTGRATLKSLRIFLSSHGRPTLSRIFAGLGFFPKLVHFNFSGWECDSEPALTRFMAIHHATLIRVLIQGHIHRLIPRLPEEARDGVSLKLTSLGLVYDVEKDKDWFASKPSLATYADNLTTLSITSSWYTLGLFSGFTRQGLNILVSSLYRPGGALLQQLRIPVEYLCPEIFDLLSTSLENLHTLSISYRVVVARPGSQEENRLIFWQDLYRRRNRYLNWKIKRLCLKSIDGSRNEQHDKRKEILASVFPSLESETFEDDHWWNVQIRIQSEFC